MERIPRCVSVTCILNVKLVHKYISCKLRKYDKSEKAFLYEKWAVERKTFSIMELFLESCEIAAF